MSENSNEEKLSFKEQILRDLERLKKEESLTEQTDDLFSNLMNSSDTKTEERVITPEEELIANSVSTVEQLIENAPAVPPRPDLKEEVTEEIAKEASVELPQSVSDKDEMNSIPTKVSVSYRTFDTASEDKEAVNLAPHKEELTNHEANEEAELPRRSRRETVKPAKKKKKSRLKGFLVTVLVLLILFGAGGFFGLRYAESALQPVDPNSKQYMTVQIPDGSSVQEIGSTLEKSGVIKNGLVFTIYAKYKNYTGLKSGY